MGDEIKTYDPSGISQKLQWVRTASKEIIQNDDVENKILGVFEKYLKEAQKKGLGLDILDSAIQRILYYMFLDSNVAHNKKDIDEAIKGIQDKGTSSFLGTIRKQTKFIESSLAAINKLQQTVPKTIEEFKANPQYQEKIGYKGEDPAEIEKYIVKTDIWDKIRMDIQKARDSGQVSYDIKQSLNTPEFQFPVSLILQEISNPSIIPVEVKSIGVEEQKKQQVRRARIAESELFIK